MTKIILPLDASIYLDYDWCSREEVRQMFISNIFQSQKISKKDIISFFEKNFGLSVKIVYIKQINQKVINVVFISPYGKCARFVSIEKLLRFKYESVLERSQDVEFRRFSDGRVFTVTGYWTDGRWCNCPSYGSGNLQILNRKTCKHCLAYAKQILGIGSFKEFVDFLG